MKRQIDYSLVPAMAPPKGVVPDFEYPDCNHSLVFVPVTICTAVATFFLLARLGTKAFIMKRINVEDCEFTSTSPSGSDTLADVLSFGWVSSLHHKGISSQQGLTSDASFSKSLSSPPSTRAFRSDLPATNGISR